MMRRTSTILGVCIGLAAAAAVLSLAGRAAPVTRLPRGTIISDCDGQLRELVIQYVPQAADIVAPVYRQFLGALPSDVAVYVMCPDQATYDDFLSRLDKHACKLLPVFTGHEMTAWSRDRWVALDIIDAPGKTLLLAPRDEQLGESWPQRAGDARVAFDLAAAAPNVQAGRSSLYFDGGDFMTDSHRVFVTPGAIERNLQNTVHTLDELTAAVEEATGRPAVLLDVAPPHHAGMFMMAAGNDTVLVGDPSLAAGLLSPGAISEDAMPGGADFSPQTQRLFDAAADRCRRAGCRVVRLPVVPGRDGRTYFAYVNVIMDARPGDRTVYMPVYRGMDNLNAAAADAWRGLGWRVVPIDCTSTYKHFGSLHCLVNVLRRSADPR